MPVPAGTLNGDSKIDQCGVCDGTNGCVDCAGTANGASKLDLCGICGSARSGCADVIVSNGQATCSAGICAVMLRVR